MDNEYYDFEKIETPEQKRERVIEADIAAIDSAIKSENEKELKNLHISIEGRYSSSIPDIGKSMYGYSKEFGFVYENLDKESLAHNLSLMKSRLEGCLYGFSGIYDIDTKTLNNINVNVPVVNEVNINLAFEQAIEKINNIEGLNDSVIEDIISKINELEVILREPTSKKKKWEKVKPIISYAIDKGADVSIAIMSLILQMKLGA